MSPIELLSYLRKLLGQVQEGDRIRAKLITSVNDLSSAIAGACTLTAMRLNQSLFASTKKEKIAVLMGPRTDDAGFAGNTPPVTRKLNKAWIAANRCLTVSDAILYSCTR